MYFELFYGNLQMGSKVQQVLSLSTILLLPQVKLCIYRTDNGCGWGVKALENIKKGSFVVEYVGEVITSEEAEKRGEKYGM